MSVAALVGSFDDIVRSASVLTEGIEGEFLKFVIQQEECRKKWLETESNCIKLKQEVAKLKAENEALDVKLKHARNQIEIEIKRRMKAETAQDHLDRQVALIRELLTDKETMSRLNENERQTLMQSIQMSHIQGDDVRSPRKRTYDIDQSSASMLSPSDISYDTTADDLDEPVRNRPPFRPPNEPTAPSVDELLETPPKKMKTAVNQVETPPMKMKTAVDQVVKETIIAGTQVTVSPDGPIRVSAYVNPVSSPKKTIRVEDIKDEGLPQSNLYPALPARTPTFRAATQNYAVKTGRRKKGHIFHSKFVVYPEICHPCGKRMMFSNQVLKCQDCKAVCHSDCKDAVPLPCIPSNLTPGSHKKLKATIEFYAPPTSPMVPHIIVNCIQEIEKRGLNEMGLYRVPGAKSSIEELKEKLLQGKMKKLHDQSIEIHVICGVLKDFFKHLSEPLVTYRLWPAFINAAVNGRDDDSNSALYQAVSELPPANRDTLAFMMKHLQRVSESPNCNMPASNLARVFGPTLIGHSSADCAPADMLRETKLLPVVMEKLLKMPTDYWNQFLNDVENLRSPPFNPNTHRSDGTPLTPECRPVPQSMLGPLTTPGAPANSKAVSSVKKKGSFLSRTPLTPRFGSKSKHNKKHLFPSPKAK